jgi:YjbE family integral membrane protein
MPEWLGPIMGIILVDLILSGDNALVIGAAATSLPRQQRFLAIALGGGGAIILRIMFAIIATLLLGFPLLRAIGGAILLVIAIRLLADRGHEKDEASLEQEVEGAGKIGRGFFPALLTILVADVTMSLDNVLAVGALAEGELLILGIGLVVSILFLLLGSALVSVLIARLPWLLDVASLVLAWTASHMILDDGQLGPILEHNLPQAGVIIPAISLAIVAIADAFLLWRIYRRKKVRTA